jgi:hypothetical protein
MVSKTKRILTYGKQSPCHVTPCIAWTNWNQDIRDSDRPCSYVILGQVSETGHDAFPVRKEVNGKPDVPIDRSGYREERDWLVITAT